MNNQPSDQPVVLDQENAVSISEVCTIVNLQAEVLCQWVAEGIVTPSGERVNEWRFSQRHIQRIRQARRLQQDLEINTASLPLVLDLLDEISQLRRRIRRLEHRYFE
ncbi:MAG: chaperone modulator CbpM [Pseudomonadota bacterium]